MTKKFPIPRRIKQMSDAEVQRGYLCNAASISNQQLANLYLREISARGLNTVHPNLCGGGSGHVPGTPRGE